MLSFFPLEITHTVRLQRERVNASVSLRENTQLDNSVTQPARVIFLYSLCRPSAKRE